MPNDVVIQTLTNSARSPGPSHKITIYITLYAQMLSIKTLDVLPGKVVRGNVQAHGKSIEAKAIRDMAGRNSSVLQSSVHLPLGRLGRSASSTQRGGSSRGGSGRGRGSLRNRAGHKARGALARVGPGAERSAGSVLEGTGRRASGNIARVRNSEAQSTGAINVDLLATGDDDVQGVAAVDDSIVLLSAASTDGGGAVGLRLAAEPEVAAGGSQG